MKLTASKPYSQIPEHQRQREQADYAMKHLLNNGYISMPNWCEIEISRLTKSLNALGAGYTLKKGDSLHEFMLNSFTDEK